MNKHLTKKLPGAGFKHRWPLVDLLDLFPPTPNTRLKPHVPQYSIRNTI
jgi:hypothetical protein